MGSLNQRGNVIAEYIWIDGTDLGLRAKARTITKKIESLDDLPEWNYDGSSTYQATTKHSEVNLKPVAYFPDPFREEPNILVLCETWNWRDTTFTAQKPCNTNFRYFANKMMEEAKDEEPWFGIEQEYTLLENKNKFTTWPLGWPQGGFPGGQGPYYCSVGAAHCFGRAIMDAHYKCCLYAGVKLTGSNSEVMPGQWEFQVGPCLGIEVGDHLWIARYLLSRVAEDFGISISYEPKLFKDWNGAGCHTNFSTKTMRDGSKGWEYIEDMM